MKTAICCIAKNEDNYIDEWAKYHHYIGFDDIYVYQNDWKYENSPIYVKCIDFPGIAQQMNAYNDFLKKYAIEYDWIAVIDVDEFICLNIYDNVNQMLQNYDDYFALGLNWRFFGSNNLEKVENNNYNVLSRFTKCQLGCNRHIKTLINIAKCRKYNIIDNLSFYNPHFVNLASANTFTISADKQSYIFGPFNYVENEKYIIIKNNKLHTSYDFPYIAHYCTKSKEEHLKRRLKIRADMNSPIENIEQHFVECDRNEEENYILSNISKNL